MSASPAKPEPAKQLLPFLQRADELHKHDLLVAYFCRLYAMELGLKIPVKERTKATNKLLESLMNQLEKDKKVVKVSPEDNLYMEGFALSVFSKADKQDRAGRADLNTAKTFYAASIFFDVLHQFGDLQPDIEQKAKYSVWKAADIRKAVSEGRKPTPGPPGGDLDQSQSPQQVSPQQGLSSDDQYSRPQASHDFQQHRHQESPDSGYPAPGQGYASSPTASPATGYAPAAAPAYDAGAAGSESLPYPSHHPSDGAGGQGHNPSHLHAPYAPFDQPQAPPAHMPFSGSAPLDPPYHPSPDPLPTPYSPRPDLYPRNDIHSPNAPIFGSAPSQPYSGGYHERPHHERAASVRSSDEVAPYTAVLGTSDGTYQPPPEKVAEAHKASRYAVSALAFDDVPTALSYLRRSLELLTSPSGTI